MTKHIKTNRNTTVAISIIASLLLITIVSIINIGKARGQQQQQAATIMCEEVVPIITQQSFVCENNQHQQASTVTYIDLLKEATKLAILDDLIISEMPRTYARSCTERPYGCEAHVEAIVELFFSQYQQRGIDPLILAAMAKHETNYNPFAVNESTGAAGLIQLMPGSHFAEGISFIHNPRYRHACKQERSACQQEVLDASLTLLERSIRRCDNSLRHGLGMYGSGSCTGSRRFANYVISHARELRQRQMHYMHELSVANMHNHTCNI